VQEHLKWCAKIVTYTPISQQRRTAFWSFVRGEMLLHEVHYMTWHTTWYKPMHVSNSIYQCVSSVFPFLLNDFLTFFKKKLWFCFALWALSNDNFLYDSVPLLHNVALRQWKNILGKVGGQKKCFINKMFPNKAKNYVEYLLFFFFFHVPSTCVQNMSVSLFCLLMHTSNVFFLFLGHIYKSYLNA